MSSDPGWKLPVWLGAIVDRHRRVVAFLWIVHLTNGGLRQTTVVGSLN